MSKLRIMTVATIMLILLTCPAATFAATEISVTDDKELTSLEAYQAIKNGELVGIRLVPNQAEIICFADGSSIEIGVIVENDNKVGNAMLRSDPSDQWYNGFASGYMKVNSDNKAMGTINLNVNYQYGDNRLNVTSADARTNLSYPGYIITNMYNRAVIEQVDYKNATITGKYEYEVKSYNAGYISIDRPTFQMRLSCGEFVVSVTADTGVHIN